MDLATIIGLAAAYFLILWGMGFSNIPVFFNAPSFLIVIGGTIGAIFTAFPMSRVLSTFAVIKNAFFEPKTAITKTIKELVSFAEQARREGILALEARSNELDDEFLKKGIQLAVDGTEPELIKDILSTEIAFLEQRHDECSKIFDAGGTLAPAFGMIGTLIGLILMLGNLEDVSTIGPNMAVALITTLYGSIFANTFFIPINQKLKVYSAKEVLLKEIMLEGVMSLQSGDNPRIVEQKLIAFIEPGNRASAMKDKGGE